MAQGLFGTQTVAPSLDTIALRPAGVQSASFLRPQSKEAGGNLKALADSLGSLNNALLNYGSTVAREDKDPDSEKNRAFADELAMKGLDDLKAYSPEGRNRIQKDALYAAVGNKAAYQFRQDIQEGYEKEFDQNNGNFNEWAGKKRLEFAETLTDPASKAAFMRSTEQFTQSFGQKDLERKIVVAKEQVASTVVDTARMSIDDGLEKGIAPSELAKTVLVDIKKSREFLNMDGTQQNAAIFAVAQEYARKGNVGLVTSLLEDDRGGVGALGKTAEYGTKSLDLIKAAQETADQEKGKKGFDIYEETDRFVSEGSLTANKARENAAALGKDDNWAAAQLDASNRNRAQAEAKAAIVKEKQVRVDTNRDESNQFLSKALRASETLNGFNELQDVEVTNPHGEGTVTISAAKRKEQVLEVKLSQFRDREDTLKANGMDEAQAKQTVINEKVQWFEKQGVVNPEWDKRFNNIGISSSVGTMIEKGEPSKQLLKDAEDYRAIATQNPAYAKKIIQDAGAQQFLDEYVEGVKDGLAPEAAALQAGRTTQLTSSQKANFQLPPNKLADASNALLDTLDSGLKDNPGNRALASDLLNKYLRRGVPVSVASARAVEDMKSSTHEVNGNLVMDRRDMQPNFSELMEARLGEIYNDAGKQNGLDSPDDLTVEEGAGGMGWVVINKKTGVPLGSGIIVTPRDLQGVQDRRNAAERETADKALEVDQEKERAYQDEAQKRIDKLRGHWNSASRKRADREEDFLLKRKAAAKEAAKNIQKKIKDAQEKQKKDVADKKASTARFLGTNNK